MSRSERTMINHNANDSRHGQEIVKTETEDFQEGHNFPIEKPQYGANGMNVVTSNQHFRDNLESTIK